MTIPFVANPGGLFNRIGSIGQVVADIQALIGNGNTLPNDITALLDQWQGIGPPNPEPDLVGLVPTQANAASLAITSLDTALQQVASQTVERMVFRDNPINSRTNAIQNLQEVIRQMLATGQTVQRCTVTATSAPFASYTNNGNGVVVLSIRRGDGLTQENALAEVARLTCTSDSQSGGAKGTETFQFQGTEAQSNPFSYEWPLGSGANLTFQAVDATKNNSGNNLLTDSAWQGTWTANVPANWVDVFGNAGVGFVQDTSSLDVYGSDANVLKFLGGNGTTPALTQLFNSAGGTTGALKPDTVYHWNGWLKANLVSGAGTFVIDLIDQNGDVISDDQSSPNSYSIPLSSVTTNYTPFNISFRAPKVLPTTARIRYRLPNPLPAGGYALFVAHTSLAVANQTYTGGPFITVHSGSSPWIKNDIFSVTVTNNRGGASMFKTFQTLWDRLFSMRVNNLLLPSSLTPTISDSLI